MIYSIDFDGTIVENDFPNIGKEIQATTDFIRSIQVSGDLWILNTMREGKLLHEAVKWLRMNGLYPDAVNDNLPALCREYGNNPRKIYADVYIDDHNAGGLKLK